jgi:CBS domain-containing protein
VSKRSAGILGGGTTDGSANGERGGHRITAAPGIKPFGLAARGPAGCGRPRRQGGGIAFLLQVFQLGSKVGSGLTALPDAQETTMRVSDILKVKGNTLFTVTPDTPLHDAVNTMAEHDIGSLVVMEYGDLVGMLTFREIIQTLSKHDGSVGTATIRKVMDDHPITCTPETDVNEVRRIMLEHHVRYLPVMESRTLMGVISFYDVAKAVVEEQGFENRMLKAYIRDWPEEPEQQQAR